MQFIESRSLTVRPSLLAALLAFHGCAVTPSPEPPIALPSTFDDRDEYGDPDYGDPDVDAEHSTGDAILMYLPNRILDVFDIVRARARVGPGAALDVRATQLVNLFMGRYQSFYLGLPGPRNRPEIKWPVGGESWSGFGVVEAEDSVDLVWEGPDYGLGEIGVGVHALLVGADVGVDPLEAVDFVLGLLTFDLRGDDL